MKLITPLWSDPIGWSDWVAKTKLRILIWTLIHIAFVGGGIIMVQKGDIVAGAAPIVFVGVAYPCMYMCAMHQLLKILKQKRVAADHVRLVSSKADSSTSPSEPSS
jgi:hypothetical protein